MIADVRTRFDAEITRVFASKPEVRDFLLKHERKELCLRNLCAEILRAEGRVLIKSAASYDSLIRDVARMFARNALQHKEEELLSPAERVRRVQEADRIKQAEEMMKDLEKEALTDDEVKAWKAQQVRQRPLPKIN